MDIEKVVDSEKVLYIDQIQSTMVQLKEIKMKLGYLLVVYPSKDNQQEEAQWWIEKNQIGKI